MIVVSDSAGWFKLEQLKGEAFTSDFNTGLVDEDDATISFGSRKQVEDRIALTKKAREYLTGYVSGVKGIMVEISVKQDWTKINHELYVKKDGAWENVMSLTSYDVKLEKLLSYLIYKEPEPVNKDMLKHLSYNLLVEFDDKVLSKTVNEVINLIDEKREEFRKDILGIEDYNL